MAEVSLIIGQRLDIELEESGSGLLGIDVQDQNEQPFNFTGYQFELVSKTARSEDLPDFFRLSSTGPNPKILLTSGNINIIFPDFYNQSGKYVYDLWATHTGRRKTWTFGALTIRPKAY